jgi:hypothetical protein
LFELAVVAPYPILSALIEQIDVSDNGELYCPEK